MDLAEFLLARLAEDEEVAKGAKAADGAHWSFRVSPYTTTGWNTEIVEYLGQAEGSGVRYIEATARHITRHDPARGLAEVEAKRGLVELHATKLTDRGTYEGRDYRSCLACDPTPPMDAPNPGPCATLKLLALPYADHPECHPSWLPAVKA